jgi:hypothetical protein
MSCRRGSLPPTRGEQDWAEQRIHEAIEHTTETTAAGCCVLTISEKPRLETVLTALSRERLYDLGRVMGAGLHENKATKTTLVRALGAVLGEGRLPAVLHELGRDELRMVCRAHKGDGSKSQRAELIESLLTASGYDPRTSWRVQPPTHDGLPRAGQVLAARGRQWLVEQVRTGAAHESPLLELACLDDDAPGKKLEMLWDLEIGARVIEPREQGLGTPQKLDPPGHFGAYLHALKWSSVSAADATRFQAPFRAGIKIMPHQLTPLMKALELPRANLFIADDVGLGKTIEAGLVMQELILRQQAGFVLVVCPASVCLQWRDEMMRRFGLRFEVMSRAFLGMRRRERGFGINPWATHNRFIVSYPLIRRPEYRDPLLAHLGHRAEKGLLILDEAHVAAPASASKYAVDSDTTRSVRDLAPKFDNRLFLSATPHNGHSNSFSALLEILDPIRFSRTSPVKDPAQLAPVMVRRLKRDLRQLGVERIPERILCCVNLRHERDTWSVTEQRYSAEAGNRGDATPIADGLAGDNTELEIAELLARYTELCAPKKGGGRFPFINLQKRLLSSPEAFARTIEVHAASVTRAGGVHVNAVAAESERLSFDEAVDPETHGEADEALLAEELDAVASASSALPSPTEEAKQLLSKMRALAAKARRKPDAKVLALLLWLRAHCCPGIGDPEAKKKDRTWTECRVILFTEYADTKRYLVELLKEAISHTDSADGRILQFHGGMGDEQREEVQRAFNAAPDEHPVRILVATDAAREGVNLQGHCADLFHMDVPWNPSRLEQRNGRIDRTLQQADEVRCHYFVYEQRSEDRVLETLFRKIQTVQAELGSMGAVLLDEMEVTLKDGLTSDTASKLDAVGKDSRAATSEQELETIRREQDRLQKENLRAGQLLERSKRALEVEPKALRGVVDVGLQLAGAHGLGAGQPTREGRATYLLPELDRSWDVTLDTLRPPRGRKESFWEWRSHPPRPVTFEPLTSLSSEAEQLHLAHPLVKRILDRFAAQGFGAHDLSRRCAVVVPGESVARVLAYARLTLFGNGAARLHDELVTVAAAWTPGETPTPYKDPVTAQRAREVTEKALATGAPAPKGRVVEQALAQAEDIFTALWPHVEAEAESRGVDAKNGLTRRARKESQDLITLLERQHKEVEADLKTLRQVTFEQVGDKQQRRQIELDIRATEDRQKNFDTQLAEEPGKIAALYDVQMTRLTPVGLVIAWPEGA